MGDLDFMSFVQSYYQKTLEKYGPTPQGVDWNGCESQNLRFQIQHNMVKSGYSSKTHILDYGCGYGEFAHFLSNDVYLGKYTGFDIVPESINYAMKRFVDHNKFNFTNKLSSDSRFDTIFASGVFNIHPGDSPKWLNLHVKKCLFEMSKMSDVVVLNFLKSNPTKPVSNLFFVSQDELKSILPADFQITNINDDYGLWEWTVVIERNGTTL